MSTVRSDIGRERRSTLIVWVQRALVVGIWLAAIVAWQLYQSSNDLSITETAQRFIDTVGGSWWGIFAFVSVYLARPIVLFPASILTIVGGILFLPYDLVNYLSGMLRLQWLPFLVATALGSLPGTVSFVLLGASIDRVDEGIGGIDPAALVISLAIFGVSLAVARLLRRRQPAPTTSPNATSTSTGGSST